MFGNLLIIIGIILLGAATFLYVREIDSSEGQKRQGKED